MEKKITYVEAVTVAIESGALAPEVVERLEALKASLEKRSKGSKKPTKEQIENEALRAKIVESAEAGKAYTLSEVGELIGGGFSSQKLSALVKGIEGVEKSYEKGKAYFVIKA